jgi:hypothetical protein
MTEFPNNMSFAESLREAREEGLREGRIRGIEETIKNMGVTIERHDSRLTAQERITYALLGAIALLEIIPTIRSIIDGG